MCVFDVLIDVSLSVYIGIDCFLIPTVDGIVSINSVAAIIAQMKDIDFTGKVIYNINDSRHVQNATKRVKKILDANYHKTNLVKVTNSCKHLVICEQAMLLSLLKRYKPMFDSTLGQWRGPGKLFY